MSEEQQAQPTTQEYIPPTDIPPQTQVPYKNGSVIFNVSMRAWLSLIIVATLCYCVIVKTDAPQYFQVIAASVVSFYFGHTIAQNGNSIKM